MFYPVKIYNKFMKLIKTLSSEKVSEEFWEQKKLDLKTPRLMKRKKRRKKNAGTTKRDNTKEQGKKRVRRSGRAR
tara:strand:+ start:279 stop:503 length:225 start_codon:yes stop_codon:yes gene_type:complete